MVAICFNCVLSVHTIQMFRTVLKLFVHSALETVAQRSEIKSRISNFINIFHPALMEDDVKGDEVYRMRKVT